MGNWIINAYTYPAATEKGKAFIEIEEDHSDEEMDAEVEEVTLG